MSSFVSSSDLKIQSEPISSEQRSQDLRFMMAALTLARKGLGRCWPNPSVGCLLVADGQIVGQGWTQPGGRPHAETEALRVAGPLARGATAYVTLEPCAHTGQTPPCVAALINAGIARLVTALADPDHRVQGAGLAKLREAGIAVTTGIATAQAYEITAGHILRVSTGRPLVTAKIATSLDARIATRQGQSQWITGPLARRAVHAFRARYDAIVVGINTVLIDDPRLDVRLNGLADRSPIRVIFDSKLRLPLTGKLVQSARDIPVWILCAQPALESFSSRAFALKNAGVKIIGLPTGANNRPDLMAALKELGKQGLTRLLVEGGGYLLASFLQANAIDNWAWFRAGIVLGGDGIAALAPAEINELSAAPRFSLLRQSRYGDDVLEIWQRSPSIDFLFNP